MLWQTWQIFTESGARPVLGHGEGHQAQGLSEDWQPGHLLLGNKLQQWPIEKQIAVVTGIVVMSVQTLNIDFGFCVSCVC
jgi:hypothetical protein